MDDLQAAIGVFNQSSSALYPVAIVAIQNSIDVANFRMVYVAQKLLNQEKANLNKMYTEI
jgi:hypothetical protein